MKKIVSIVVSIAMLLTCLPLYADRDESADRELMSALIATATGKACIDFPDSVNGDSFTGTILIQGWIIDKNDVSEVYVQIDSREVLAAEQYDRADVAEAFPGYPTGKEGFTLTLPAKDYPAGVHTVKISYTSGSSASYSFNPVSFTVTDTPSYASSYKSNGHTYYLFDNHYTRAEAKAYAASQSLALADVSGTKAKQAVQAAARQGGSLFYWVSEDQLLDAKTGVVTASDADYVEEKCGFILEAVDISPAAIVKATDAVYAIIDAPLTEAQATSLKKTMNGTLVSQSEVVLFSSALKDMEQKSFRLESGYADRNGAVFGEASDAAMGIVFKYAKASLPSASVSYNGSTFYAVSSVMPWAAAAAMAEMMGGRLAVIPDINTQDQLKTIVSGSSNFSYWVGGNDLQKEGVFEWIDGTKLDSSLRYQTGEPNNYDHNEDYLMIYRDSDCAINDNNTHDPKSMTAGFILEVKDTDTLVPIDAVWFQNHAYIRYEGAFTRIAAEHAASSVRGKLLSIDSDQERLALANFVKDSAQAGYWTKDKDTAFSTYAANLYQVTEASSSVGLIVEFDGAVTVAAQKTNGGVRYAAYTADMPFEAAQAYATAMGGSPALPVNETENALIGTMLSDAPGKYFIGAKKQNDSFLSMDKNALSYTAWGADQSGTYACTDKTGTWQAVLHAQPEPIGFIVAYTENVGMVMMDSLYKKDGVNKVCVEIAPYAKEDATLLYCMYDEEGRFIGVASEKLTVAENIPQYKEKEFSREIASVRVLLWDNTKQIKPIAKAEETTVISSYEAQLPEGNTDFAAFVKDGIYYLRNRATKTYLALSTVGMAADTKAQMEKEPHAILTAFYVTSVDDRTTAISPLCANNGTGNRLTITASGADYARDDSTYCLVQNTDGTFCVTDGESLVFSDALHFEDYTGADHQKWELLPAEKLSEKSGALRRAANMYTGASTAYTSLKSLAAADAVTVYAKVMKGEDGAEWCYLSDGTTYGFMKKEDIKISGDSIYTYEEALAKKGAKGDGKGVLGYGVDVSTWDKDVDYNTLKANGYSYVIIRIGTNYRGTYNKDTYFEQNYTNARAAGMDVGVYFYTYSTSVAGSQQDADQVAAWLNGRELTYPVYYDLEDATISAACSYSTITEMARTFLSRMENTHGYYSGVYANLNWMNNMFDSKDIGKNYDLWVARYTYSVNVDYSSTFGMWQYSGDHEYIAGMPNTQADLNVVYKNYPEIIRALGMSYTGN